MPRRDRLGRHPHRQAAAVAQRDLVLPPVLHPVTGFRDFVTAGLVMLVRHRQIIVPGAGGRSIILLYTPSHRGSAKVVAWRGILDSSSGDDSGRLSVGERTGGPDCAGAEWFGGASGRASGQCDLVAGQGLELREGRRGPFA